MRKQRRKWSGKPAAMVDAWSGWYGYEDRKKKAGWGLEVVRWTGGTVSYESHSCDVL